MKIVTAWAEQAAGPGWSNQLVWYIWRDDSGKLHQDCLQPEQQTPEMRFIFGFSALAHRQIRKAVEDALAGGDEGREG